jgi:hypothetical protein
MTDQQLNARRLALAKALAIELTEKEEVAQRAEFMAVVDRILARLYIEGYVIVEAAKR